MSEKKNYGIIIIEAGFSAAITKLISNDIISNIVKKLDKSKVKTFNENK